MKAQHVYVRISGYGLALLPYAPFRIRRASGEARLRFASPAGEAILDAARPASVRDIVDVSPGPATAGWTLETSPWTIRWPDGYTVVSSDTDIPPGFDLAGDDSSRISVQGPFCAAPTERKLLAPGQKKVAQGPSWITVEYEHDGLLWRQTHFTVQLTPRYVVVVTGQALAENAAIFEVTTQVAESTRPPE